MPRDVLIVDEDESFLSVLKDGLEDYTDSFAVITASGADQALDCLGERVYSALALSSNLALDGSGFLEIITESYPEVPVIIMAVGKPEGLDAAAQSDGVAAVLEKPFEMSDLARHIGALIKKEADAGSLRGVSPGMFLQMIEMEERSCTIRMAEKTSNVTGVLFFSQGELVDARVKNRTGEEAAYLIFSWDEVALSIQTGCPVREKKVASNAQALLLEAMRRKDEVEPGGYEEPGDLPPPEEEESLGSMGSMGDLGGLGDLEDLAADDEEAEPEEAPIPGVVAVSSIPGIEEVDSDAPLTAKSVAERLENELGNRCGLEECIEDQTLEKSVQILEAAAALFDGGRLRIGYMDRENQPDLMIVRGETLIRATLNPRCPTSRIIQLLAF
ncbi:MAG: DUF4388 domain-containing protein [Pseudomonadota bacterium]